MAGFGNHQNFAHRFKNWRVNSEKQSYYVVTRSYESFLTANADFGGASFDTEFGVQNNGRVGILARHGESEGLDIVSQDNVDTNFLGKC